MDNRERRAQNRTINTAGLSEQGLLSLGYAQQGLRVYPTDDGAKTPRVIWRCRDGSPRRLAWGRLATTDPATLVAWWTRWPNANIATPADGFLVVDLDGESDEDAWLEMQVWLKADFEATAALVNTGGQHQGRHVWFSLAGTGQELQRTLVDLLKAQGIEVRGMGTRPLLLPGSFVRSTYRLTDDSPHSVTEAGAIPGPLLELARQRASKARAIRSVRRSTCAGRSVGLDRSEWRDVRQGCRNTTATKVAGYLVGIVRLTEEQAWAKLQAWNLANCLPPLPGSELRRVLKSIVRSEQRQDKVPHQIHTRHRPVQPTNPLWAALQSGRLGAAATWLGLAVASWCRLHPGLEPAPATVATEGLVGLRFAQRYWHELVASPELLVGLRGEQAAWVAAVPEALLLVQQLPWQVKLTGAVLATLVGYGDELDPVAQLTLARLRRLERQAVGLHLQALERAGLLQVSRAFYSRTLRRRHDVNRYYFGSQVPVSGA